MKGQEEKGRNYDERYKTEVVYSLFSALALQKLKMVRTRRLQCKKIPQPFPPHDITGNKSLKLPKRARITLHLEKTPLGNYQSRIALIGFSPACRSFL